MTIKDQIFSALNAAHLENEYPHNFGNNPQDIVAEILDKKQGIKSLMLRMFSNFITR